MHPSQYGQYHSTPLGLPGRHQSYRTTLLLRQELESLLDHDTHAYQVFPESLPKVETLVVDARLRLCAHPVLHRGRDRLDPALGTAHLQRVCQGLDLYTRFED